MSGRSRVGAAARDFEPPEFEVLELRTRRELRRAWLRLERARELDSVRAIVRAHPLVAGLTALGAGVVGAQGALAGGRAARGLRADTVAALASSAAAALAPALRALLGLGVRTLAGPPFGARRG